MDERPAVNPLKTLYLVMAVAFSSVLAFTPNAKVPLGFGAKTSILFLGSIFGYVGALVGDFVRRIALPDAIFTTGGLVQILKTKLFWAIGPQAIGMGIGAFIAIGIVLSVAK